MSPGVEFFHNGKSYITIRDKQKGLHRHGQQFFNNAYAGSLVSSECETLMGEFIPIVSVLLLQLAEIDTHPKLSPVLYFGH